MPDKKLKGDALSFEGEVFTYMGVGLGGRFKTASIQDSNGETLDEFLVDYDERKVKVTIEFLD